MATRSKAHSWRSATARTSCPSRPTSATRSASGPATPSRSTWNSVSTADPELPRRATFGGQMTDANLSPVETGYAPVNGLSMYYEIHGQGWLTLLLHGAYGTIPMFAEL